MAPQHNPPIVIDADQNRTTVARHAQMLATQKLTAVAAIQPYQLGDAEQRGALIEMLDRMGYSIELPPRAECGHTVVYPVVITGPDGPVPILFHDTEILPAVVSIAVATEGLDAAKAFNYRLGMLPVKK